MDELKQRDGIDNALRELAKLRDRRLRAAPSLSPERRAALAGFLAAEFPVEAVLREVATKRDQLLNPHPPIIPVVVESVLSQQLQAVEAARNGGREWRASHWRIGGWAWRRIFRSPLGVGLTACAVIITALACFDRWGTLPRRSATTENVLVTAGVNLESAVTLDRPPSSRAELFSRRITLGPFNLNTSEPASLEASFVSNRRIQFADGIETPLGLRLDLPVRATLMEDGFARTP
jgi:hypothetical protein